MVGFLRRLMHEYRVVAAAARLRIDEDRAYMQAVLALVPEMEHTYSWLIGRVTEAAQYHEDPVAAGERYLRDHMPDGLAPVERDALRAACEPRLRSVQDRVRRNAGTQQPSRAYDREGPLRLD